MFVGNFCPPGSGSGYGSMDPVESGSNPDPDTQHCLKIIHKNMFVGVSINPFHFPLTKAGLFNGVPEEADISVETTIYPSQILLYLLQFLGLLFISLLFSRGKKSYLRTSRLHTTLKKCSYDL
jgi:hypothetical protein